MTPPTPPPPATASADFEARFYAPQARLVFIDDVDGVLAADRIDLDLISARVTLVNTNVAQLQVVLNNQRFDAEGMPVTPPWKYNQLDKVRFGQRIRLDLRYGDRPWTKMILAQVNDLQYSFPAGGGAQLTIIGEDLLCLLKRKPETDQKFEDGLFEEVVIQRSIEQAIKDLIKPSNTQLAPINAAVRMGVVHDPEYRDDGVVVTEAALVAWPERSRGLPPQRHNTDQTYLQFIQNLADRMDLEVFVDFRSNFLPETEPLLPTAAPNAAAPAPGKPAGDESNDLVFHVEPARSLLPRSAQDKPAERRVVDLRWGGNLIEFTPKLKVWDLVTAVRVKGRPRLSSTPINKTIRDGDADAIVGLDLAEVANVIDLEDQPPGAWTAVALRKELLGIAAEPEPVEFTNLDEERALIKAHTQLRTRARELLTAEAQVVGFPTLRAGLHVRIDGLSVPFNGIYYVTKAVHVFDASGYKTMISLRRPGMLPPDHVVAAKREREERAS